MNKIIKERIKTIREEGRYTDNKPIKIGRYDYDRIYLNLIYGALLFCPSIDGMADDVPHFSGGLTVIKNYLKRGI